MKIKGHKAERIVVNFLKKRGYKILACNFRSYSLGEIDILAQKDSKLHCLEVKSSFRGQKPLWLKINKKKIAHISKTLEFWLKLNNSYWNFDREIDLAIVIFKNKKAFIKIWHNISL